MRRSLDRTSHVSIERRGKKKLNGNYQKFDPNSIFAHVEETPGNFLGRVTKSGTVPRVSLISHALGSKLKEFDIHFRKDSETEVKPDQFSHFKPGAFNTPKIAVPPGEKMNVGDIVELKSCYVSDNENALYPWEFDLIATKASAPELLMMPEIPSCIISRHRLDDPVKREYQIASAARGEAKKITGFLDNLPLLKQHLGYQMPMVNGFILRGPFKRGQKVWHGYTCVKTLNDFDENLSNDQIIFNFLKAKGHGVIDHISEDNPWEIIPLYIGRPTVRVRERLDQFFQNKHYMSFGVMGTTDLKFVHCNIVLSPTSSGPHTIRHFNLSRSKPLQMDASVPERAVEKRIKEMTAEPIHA